MDGVLNILKPPGMTSHDVVGYIRRITGLRRVGHTGTLDPAAAGVLPICLGKGTRIAEYLQASDKSYRGEIYFGITTDTQDATGRIIAEAGSFQIPWSQVEKAAKDFEGSQQQIPPMVSAVKIKGQPLYKWAHRGEEIARPPRRITVYRLQFRDPPALITKGSRVLFDIDCSKGTYVRTICHDLGQRLGTGAHLSFLLRTKTGPCTLEQAVTLEEVAADYRRHLLPMDEVLSFPAIYLDGNQARKVLNGVAIPLQGETGLVRLYDRGGLFLAIGHIQSGICAPKKVLAEHGQITGEGN